MTAWSSDGPEGDVVMKAVRGDGARHARASERGAWWHVFLKWAVARNERQRLWLSA